MTEFRCWLPLPSRIPNEDCSFSDHEAVAAVIKLSKNPETKQNKSEFRKKLKLENRNEIDQAVKDAIEIMDKNLVLVEQNSFLYMTFFILTFVFSSLVLYFKNFDISISISIIILAIFLILVFFVAILFNEREKNAFISTKKELNLLLCS